MSYPYKTNMYASMKPKRRNPPTTGESSKAGSHKRPRVGEPPQVKIDDENADTGRESAEPEEGEVAGPSKRISTSAGADDKERKPTTKRPVKDVVDMRIRKPRETPTGRRHLLRLISAKDAIAEVFLKIEKYGSALSPRITKQDIRSIRWQLHHLAFDVVSRETLQRSNIIPKALSPLTRPSSRTDLCIPDDIISDANWLKRKWQRSDFSTDLLRGIDIKQRKYNANDTANSGIKSGTSYNLDKTYPHKISPFCVGHNGLEVGNWWPLQICTLRDGAHGEIEAGIHGFKELGGALSIVLSSGPYQDSDHGNTIFYCGTKGSDGKISTSTQYMLQSLETGTPVRVLRSSKCKESIYRPVIGIRYDGLYKVMNKTILSEGENHYRFCLEREKNQPDIRWLDEAKEETKVTARPTSLEQSEWDEIKKKRKIDW